MSDAAILIRSLMRDLGVSGHTAFDGDRPITTERVLKELEEQVRTFDCRPISLKSSAPVSVVDHRYDFKICNNQTEMLLTLNADGTITFSDRYLNNPDEGVQQFIALVLKHVGLQQPAPTGISDYGAIDQGYEPNG